MRTKYIALLTVSLVVLGLYVATRSVPRHSRAPNPETSARATEAPNPRTVGPNNPRDPKAEKGERSTPPTLLAEMAPFEQWLRAFQLGQNPTPTEGQRLAAVRRSALKTLIAVDPKTALAHAVDADLRETLPLSIVALLETPVNAFGKYTVIAACGPTSASVSRWVETDSNCYQAYVYGQRLAALSKDRMAIHGIALDDEMAVSEKSYRTLGKKEAAIHAQAGAVVVQVGNAYRAFSTAADLNQWQANVTEAENVPGPGAVQALLVPMTAGSGGNTVTAADVTSSWVFGNKSVLWIRAEFPDDPGSPASDQDVGTAMTAVNSFYARNSRNRTSFTTTVVPGTFITVPKATVQASTSNAAQNLISDDVLQQARNYDAAHGATGMYNPDKYDRWIVVFKQVNNTVGSLQGDSGIGVMGGKGLWLNGLNAPSGASAGVVAHELGHNQGLGHSHGWDPPQGSMNPIDPAGSSYNGGYGDVYDVMGDSSTLWPICDFNVRQKRLILYLDPGQITAATTSGTYRINRHDSDQATGVVALQISPAGASPDRTYWVECRQADYSATSLSAASAYRTHNGIQLRWGPPPAFVQQPASDTGPSLLDATPNSSDKFKDCAFVLGQPFTDASCGITITPIAEGGNEPGQWIDVQVQFTDPQKIPTIALASAPVLGGSVDIATNTAAASVRTQLLVDGVLWQERFAVNPSFTWTPFTPGAHVLTIKAIYADGSLGINTQSVNVGLDAKWTWITPLPQSNSPNALAYGLGQWWATAAYGNLISSADGVTWTARPSPVHTNLNSIASDGAKLFLTCGATDSITGASVSAMWRSTDGVNWIPITPTTAKGQWGANAARDVFFINNTWVVLGSLGGNDQIITSTDGLTWANPVDLPTKNTYRWIANAAGRWVAAGSNGTVATSTNLVTWTSAGALPAGLTTCYGVTCNNGIWLTSFYDTASAAPLYFYSTDLQTWTKGNSPDGSTVPACLAQANGLFVAATYSYVSTSPDALTWTKYSLPVSNIAALAQQNGKFYAAGTQDKMYTGTTLANLTVTDTYARPNFSAACPMANGAMLFCDAAYSSTNNGSYCPLVVLQNGTLKTSNATGAMYGIAANNGLYVAVGANGKICTSTDGLNWTTQTSGTTQQLNGVITLAGKFVVVGNAGTILTSPDGTNWTARTGGTTQNLLAIAANASLIVTVGNGGTLLTSPDGNTWTGRTSGNTNNLTGIVWQPGLGFCVLDSTRTTLATSGDGSTWTQTKTPFSWYGLAATPYGLVATGNGVVAITTDGLNWFSSYVPTNTGMLSYANQTLYTSNNTNLLSMPLAAQAPTPLVVVTQPLPQITPVGASTSFSVESSGSGPVTYQWYKNGQAIGGATSATYTIASAQLADAGSYTVTVTNSVNAITSNAAVLTVNPAVTPTASRITSLSIRIGAGTGDQTLIAGFAISGDGKSLLVRGVGPTLGAAPFNVPGVLADPQLGLFNSNTQINSNDNWSDAANASQVAATAAQLQDFALPVGSKDAALLTTLNDGLYTAQVSGVGNTTGIALVEVYDANPAAASRLTGVSARTQVGTGANILIAGFAITGTAPMKVLLRGVGPTLASFAVTGVLADPQIAVYTSPGGVQIASNDNWSDNANAAQIAANSGFPLLAGSKDAALLLTLNPGTYTVQVSGVGNTTGVALVEVYEVP